MPNNFAAQSVFCTFDQLDENRRYVLRDGYHYCLILYFFPNILAKGSVEPSHHIAVLACYDGIYIVKFIC